MAREARMVDVYVGVKGQPAVHLRMESEDVWASVLEDYANRMGMVKWERGYNMTVHGVLVCGDTLLRDGDFLMLGPQEDREEEEDEDEEEEDEDEY